ncbi:MAG: SGNH/GDSL hydrolase family protein [Thermoanaerobaculia bacterium]
MARMRSTVACLGAGLLALCAGVQTASAAADLNRFVVLGDSFAAGFADGGLAAGGQRSGFARRIAGQANGATASFEQPVMSAPGIPAVNELSGGAARVLTPKAGLGSPINLTLPRPYDNLAVPGALAGDVHRTRSDGGGLHDLILRGLGSQLEQAQLLEPTFVSLWVGSTDALRAAVSGVVLDGVTLTPTADFAAHYNLIVQTLVAGGTTDGVVATIPEVTALPFVTTAATVVAVDSGSGFGVPLAGPDGPLSDGDSVLMSATPLLARGDGVPVELGGSGRPLPDNVVLSRKEARQIRGRVAEYNRVIRRAAADVGFAVVETAAVFDEAKRRLIEADLFSLDGIHPSPLGQALLANAFIGAINRTYGGSIPEIDITAESATLGLRGSTVAERRIVFSRRAYRSLRFSLGIPKTGRLLRMKQRALRRLEQERRKRLERFRRYKLPPPPRLAQVFNRTATTL